MYDRKELTTVLAALALALESGDEAAIAAGMLAFEALS